MEKIFVTIDEANDLKAFNELGTWKDNDGYSYDLINGAKICARLDKEDDEVLKERLHELMDECDVCVVVVGQKTKSFRRFTRWQIEYASEQGLPIICLNLNGIRSVDYDRCPTYLKRHLSLHITFQNEIFNFAMKNWPHSYARKHEAEENKTYRYSNDVYENLGLHTADFA